MSSDKQQYTRQCTAFYQVANTIERKYACFYVHVTSKLSVYSVHSGIACNITLHHHVMCQTSTERLHLSAQPIVQKHTQKQQQ
jgi:hypothetical protein